MRFQTISQLMEHIEALGDIKSLEFGIEQDVITESVEVEEPLVESLTGDFSDNPIIEFLIDRNASTNTLFVEDFETVSSDVCFTGKVTLLNTTLLCNICENADGCRVSLPMIVDGKHTNISFALAKGSTTSAILNPALI